MQKYLVVHLLIKYRAEDKDKVCVYFLIEKLLSNSAQFWGKGKPNAQ